MTAWQGGGFWSFASATKDSGFRMSYGRRVEDWPHIRCGREALWWRYFNDDDRNSDVVIRFAGCWLGWKLATWNPTPPKFLGAKQQPQHHINICT
jgi:hypothetical protein